MRKYHPNDVPKYNGSIEWKWEGGSDVTGFLEKPLRVIRMAKVNIADIR